MKNAPKNRLQRGALMGVAGLALLGATGCSATNLQATTLQYNASDGVHATVGPVEVRNIMLISNGAEEEARVLGSLYNDTDSDVQVTLQSEDGSSVELTVPADNRLSLEEDENEAVFASAGEDPGALVPVTIQVNSDTTEVRVPVLNGALPEYREFVPGGFDEAALEHLAPTEAATEH